MHFNPQIGNQVDEANENTANKTNHQYSSGIAYAGVPNDSSISLSEDKREYPYQQNNSHSIFNIRKLCSRNCEIEAQHISHENGKTYSGHIYKKNEPAWCVATEKNIFDHVDVKIINKSIRFAGWSKSYWCNH